MMHEARRCASLHCRQPTSRPTSASLKRPSDRFRGSLRHVQSRIALDVLPFRGRTGPPQRDDNPDLQRRSVLVAVGMTLLLPSPARSEETSLEALIPEGFDFGIVRDPILAYAFLYPKQYASGKALPMTFYRKPVKYGDAAPQSVEGRERIVCGLGAFDQGVVVSVSVGPLPATVEGDPSTWTAAVIATAVLSDRSVSRLAGSRKVPIASIENAKEDERNGHRYWSYESIISGSPTSRNRSKETYRHTLSVTSVRNGNEGTPFLYTLSLSCPQDRWDDLSPLFGRSVASFRLMETTTAYRAPDEKSLLPFL